jgi:hypothetical protein
MIPVLPKCSFSFLAGIEFLGGPAGYQLKTLGNNIFAGVDNQQVDMVRGDGIVENTKTVPFLCLKKPVEPSLPVFLKFQQKFLFMTSVRYVPGTTGKIMPVGSWHEGKFS